MLCPKSPLPSPFCLPPLPYPGASHAAGVAAPLGACVPVSWWGICSQRGPGVLSCGTLGHAFLCARSCLRLSPKPLARAPAGNGATVGTAGRGDAGGRAPSVRPQGGARICSLHPRGAGEGAQRIASVLESASSTRVLCSLPPFPWGRCDEPSGPATGIPTLCRRLSSSWWASGAAKRRGVLGGVPLIHSPGAQGAFVDLWEPVAGSLAPAG